uniref:Uncharacterized protein n=1 Tax=Arundo donax TaxID=35708 RepID=A0A0A8YRC0_ARUDO
MVSQLMEEVSQTRRVAITAAPLPDCDYILPNRPTARPVHLTTATKAGRVMKRKGKGAALGKKKAAPGNK